MEHLEHSRRRLATDVKTVIADIDEMRKALTAQSNAAGVCANCDAALRRARMRIAETQAVARARARRAIGEVDVFAHRHPWRTAGMAAATSVALGAVIGILARRH